MRTFISLNVSCTDSISRLLKDLNDLKIKTVDPNQLHITLKFLGDVDESTVDKVKTTVDSICSDAYSFDLTLTDVGSFSRKDGSGIVWIGSDNDEVSTISKKLDNALFELGIPKETKPFKNHITVARPKYNIKQITNYLNSKEYVFEKQQISSVFLMSSVLTKNGEIYKIEKEFSLRMKLL